MPSRPPAPRRSRPNSSACGRRNCWSRRTRPRACHRERSPASGSDRPGTSRPRARSACSASSSGLATSRASASPDGRSRSAPRDACCSTCATRRNPRCHTCAASAARSATRRCCSTPRRAAISNSTRASPDATDSTLVDLLDRTATAMGGRELRRWVQRPVAATRSARGAPAGNRGLPRHRPARSRSLAAATRGRHRAHPGAGGAAIGTARATSRACATRSAACPSCSRSWPASIRRCSRGSPQRRARTRRRTDCSRRALLPTPAAMLREGGVIAPGHDADLDELRRIAEHSDEALLELEARERERTGFANLRFGYNRVQGYYIEVSRSQADQVPADWVRRQTVKNAERYITSESKTFEDRVLRRARPLAGPRARTLRGPARPADRTPARAAGDRRRARLARRAREPRRTVDRAQAGQAPASG